MKWTVFALAALLCAAPASSQNNTQWSTAIPPERFQGPAVVPIAFVPPSQVAAACNVPLPEGMVLLACTSAKKRGVRLIVMPDPCALADTEFYARIMCHELGHSKGWSGNHED